VPASADPLGPIGSLGVTTGGLAAALAANSWGGRPQGGSSAALLAQYVLAGSPSELQKAFAWLESDVHLAVAIELGRRGPSGGYDLFALSRLGLVGGRKFLGRLPWYRALAERVVAEQRPDGSWAAAGIGIGGVGEFVPGDELTESAFRLLFLSAGRTPVVMNKLMYDGSGGGDNAWNARPRDVASATRFVVTSAERAVGWQVVDLRQGPTEWADAPVLYVAGEKAVRLSSENLAAVRTYLAGGGTVFLHADRGASAFNAWAKEFCEKVCPGSPLADVAADDPLYSAVHKVSPKDVKLRAARDGSRVLVVLSPNDLAGTWQAQVGRLPGRADPPAFRVMANVYAVALGRSAPGPRLVADRLPPAK
jgi:hypothetical protein